MVLSNPKVGCFAVYELSEEDWQGAGELLDQYRVCLEKAGMEVVTAPVHVTDEASCKEAADYFALNRVDVISPLIVTWCLDHYVWMIQKETGVPVAVRAIPGLRNGSALGAQQVGCILGDLEIEHRIYYSGVDDAGEAERLGVFARACAAKNMLSKLKLCMAGRRTPGMTPTAFDEVEVMRIFGCRVVTYGMDEITAMGDIFSLEEVLVEWEKVRKNAASVHSTVLAEEEVTIRYYLALKKLLKEQGFGAVTVGCYPSYCGKTCLPVALLNDEGIPAGCEGDLNSTIAMAVLHHITGKPVHFGEMCAVDRENNYILSSHCGAAPISMADQKGYFLYPVRLANTGVCVRYSAKAGTVTYVNLVGRKDQYRLCAFEGQAVETPLVYEGNPMKIIPRTPLSYIWDTVAEHSFGHHWMAVYGSVCKELEEFCKIVGIKGVFPDKSWK